MNQAVRSAAPVAVTTPDLSAVKQRQQAAWASGDYAIVGTTLQIVGDREKDFARGRPARKTIGEVTDDAQARARCALELGADLGQHSRDRPRRPDAKLAVCRGDLAVAAWPRPAAQQSDPDEES